MKKGLQIKQVIIQNGHVTAIDSSGDNIKISRSQRNALTDIKNPNYIENIKKEFHNEKIIHNEFSVVKDGNVIK